MKTLHKGAMPVGDKKVILYVEDDPANQRLACCRLECKYRVLLAGNDRTACDILTTGEENLHVILMDIELKDSKLNGIELCKLIRGMLPERTLPIYARDIKKSKVTIILVTAFANEHLNGNMQAAGVSYVINKPVNFVELELAISCCLLKQAAEVIRH